MDQLDLIDIYRALNFTFFQTMKFTFFSSANRTFPRTEHILGHKSSLGKLKNKTKQTNKQKTEIISNVFSDHNAVRLDVNYGGGDWRKQQQQQTIKSTNIWRLNKILLNNQQITEETKKRIKANKN